MDGLRLRLSRPRRNRPPDAGPDREAHRFASGGFVETAKRAAPLFALAALCAAGPALAAPPAVPPGAATADVRPAACTLAAGGLEREIALDGGTEGAWVTTALRLGTPPATPPGSRGTEAPPTSLLPAAGASPEFAIDYAPSAGGESVRLTAADPHRLVSLTSPPAGKGEARVVASLDALKVPLRVTIEYQAFDGHPVIRQRVSVENRGQAPLRIRRISLLALRAAFPPGGFEGLRDVVERVPGLTDRPMWFNPAPFRVGPGSSRSLRSGHRKAATWLGLAAAGVAGIPSVWERASARDLPGPSGRGPKPPPTAQSGPEGPSHPGVFVGWETNVPAEARFGDLDGDGACRIEVSIEPDALLDPGGRFDAPEAFVGAFVGDLDEAAYRTHRFVEDRVARPVDDARFPYLLFNTWGYGPNVDDGLAREAIERCAKLGVEGFVVDFGWEDPDWAPRKDRFPQGLAPLADIAHAKGMKFGTHFAFGNISSLSKAYPSHPEWAFGDGMWCYKDKGKPYALSLFHPGARAWVLDTLQKAVARDKLDWLVTDTTLWGLPNPEAQDLRASRDYTAIALGYERTLDELNRRLPKLMIEACDGGGSLFTYRMARNHVTSPVRDNDDVLPTRIAIHFNTYPLPPRYQDSYMQEWGNAYCHRSHMFGGPWIFMFDIREIKPGSEKWKRMEKDVATYKELRGLIREGKVLHLAPPWALDAARPWDGWDAIGSYHPGKDRAVVFVFRTRGDVAERTIPLKALRPEGRYRVRFEDARKEFVKTGAELMRDGIHPALEPYEAHKGTDVHASEIVYIDPAP